MIRALSFIVSTSCTPVTVTSCVSFQSVVENVRLCGLTVAEVSSVLATTTVTVPVGSAFSFTVKSAVEPSLTVNVDTDSSRPGSGSAGTIADWARVYSLNGLSSGSAPVLGSVGSQCALYALTRT